MCFQVEKNPFLNLVVVSVIIVLYCHCTILYYIILYYITVIVLYCHIHQCAPVYWSSILSVLYISVYDPTLYYFKIL